MPKPGCGLESECECGTGEKNSAHFVHPPISNPRSTPERHVCSIGVLYWVYRADLELLCKVQMEQWDRTVLIINATCADQGPKCLQC